MKKQYFYFIFLLHLISCTEPYALQSQDFVDAIVVEATLTNELKKQEIIITRSYLLEQLEATKETGAMVYITDSQGNRFNFTEENGKYVSQTAFQALPEVNYQLFITTKDGKIYSSSNEKLPTVSPLQEVTTKVITKSGIRGVSIEANSFDPSNTSKYYRYTYSETSKITAPKWNAYDLILLNNPRICFSANFGGFESIGFQLRNYESQTCYKTYDSNAILLFNTTNLTEDRVANFPIRFISNEDYTIAERYSIEVTQYVQNFSAHSYYKTLKKISENGDLLSGNQPGLVKGNLQCLTNTAEPVLGIFEVASVSKKRIFFNFRDIFPSDSFPKYFIECEEYSYDSLDFGKPDPRPGAEYPCGNGGQGTELRNIIRVGLMKYYSSSYPIFNMVKPMCGDCTTIGSNIKPLFWID